MTRMIRLLAVSTVALGLTACGGGAKLGGGKTGAAQAAFQASQGASRAQSKAGQALLDKALASGTATLTISAPCAKSGTVGVSLGGNSASSDTFSYVMHYDACNEDGHNAYTGQMTTSMSLNTDPHSAQSAFVIAMKGKLTIDGEVSDFIDADVRLSMDLTATALHSGSVSLVLDGTIKTSTQSYTYAHETLATSAGELPKD